MQLVDEDVSAFFTGTEERDEPTNNYKLHSHPISEYNAMHKYLIPFIPLHDFLSHIKRYIVYIFLSKIFPFSVSFRGHEKFKK